MGFKEEYTCSDNTFIVEVDNIIQKLLFPKNCGILKGRNEFHEEIARRPFPIGTRIDNTSEKIWFVTFHFCLTVVKGEEVYLEPRFA